MGYGIGLICGIAIIFIALMGGPTISVGWLVFGIILTLVSLALILVDA